MEPTLWMPSTFQMLISNILFDTLTIYGSYKILSWAVFKPLRKKTLRIPIAVIFNLILAAIFACCSIYFGLIFSSKQIAVHEVLNILKGRTLDGSNSELGPYIFTMHTTFIPTLILLVFIFVGWIAKVVILPLYQVLYKGKELDHPHSLTAGVFGFVGAIFGVLFLIV